MNATVKERFAVKTGRQYPLGSTPDAHGTNFSLFSPHADGVELLLFDAHDDVTPVHVVKLDPRVHKTFQFWHVYVEGVKAGTHYAYRVHGPNEPNRGLRFNNNKVLIDPYAKGNTKTLWRRGDACGDDDNLATSLRSVVIDVSKFTKQTFINRPMSESIIYEMHVGGFTRSTSAGVKNPGTFDGIVEKIPYLKDLGVTAVELLPVFEFDNTEKRIVDGKELTNYWGYSTMAYFAPHPMYCVNPENGNHVAEFRAMVKAFHEADIEVILDVVFNHTDEGNHQGPVYSFKGIANNAYYYLMPEQRQYYNDYTGCGNTFNVNHPIGEKFILDCLRYWVQVMGVDGFRFDEGSVLSRGEDGAPLKHPPVLWQIELDDVLVDTKVIAEAWDAAGLYQVGHFPGARWADWNGKFRDHIRQFVRGEAGMVDGSSMVGAVASRICGSPDIYQWSHHLPQNSVNFIACHDGFTLNDLVCYNEKHNEANGEGNRDGINENLSSNYGMEGPSDDPAVERLRDQQVRNFAAILMLSQGVPMLLMGDEVRRSQNGNNNAYCQDNELNWFDWNLTQKNAHIFRFWKWMINFRKMHPAVHRSRYFTGETNARGLADITWHGTRPHHPDWSPQSRVLAFTLGGDGAESDILVIMNMYWEPIGFELPQVEGFPWYRAVDTSKESPYDILEPGNEELTSQISYVAQGRSIAVFITKVSDPAKSVRPERKAKSSK
ncbi:MAG: glycogen debranching protein GlgX [Rhodoferax sp.]|nr:glycogen debranching protein GlgX [Rhodoferax sp.]MCF8210093.1 glycogen debranching protein GlgX [Rhodoferax sp.]